MLENTSVCSSCCFGPFEITMDKRKRGKASLAPPVDEEDADRRMMKYLGKKLKIKDSKAEKKFLGIDGFDCTFGAHCLIVCLMVFQFFSRGLRQVH